MKARTAVLTLRLIVFIAAALPLALNAQATVPDANVLSGIRRGQGQAQETGLPLITLTLAREGGNFSGALLLWVRRIENGKPVASEPGVPEPILNPTFDGRMLTFQTKYRGPLPRGVSSSDPLLTYRLKLIAPNQAELARADLIVDAGAITGSPQPLGAPVQMVRGAN